MNILTASLVATLLCSSISMGNEIYEPAGIQADLQADSKYQYNIYYDSGGAVNDAVLDLRPSLVARTKPRYFLLEGGLDGYLEQYASAAIQNHFDFSGNSKILMNAEGNTVWRILGTFKSFSDPSPSPTFGRVGRTVAGGGAGVNVRNDKGNALDVFGRASSEQFTIPTLKTKYLDNMLMEASAQYNNAFLPETAWISRATAGLHRFPTKTMLDPQFRPLSAKNDSVYGLLESGFLGRLTEKSTIDSAVGWMLRSYSADTAPSDNFSGPVFYMRFAEQVSRKDQLMVGYNYTVEDSYYTNYVLTQEIYLGLSRVVGDQLLFLARTTYEYRNYSLPNRRDDVRITAGLSAKYSISNTIKLTTDLKIDLLSSDAYDNADPNNGDFLVTSDRPSSYKAGSFGVGLVASY